MKKAAQSIGKKKPASNKKGKFKALGGAIKTLNVAKAKPQDGSKNDADQGAKPGIKRFDSVVSSLADQLEKLKSGDKEVSIKLNDEDIDYDDIKIGYHEELFEKEKEENDKKFRETEELFSVLFKEPSKDDSETGDKEEDKNGKKDKEQEITDDEVETSESES